MSHVLALIFILFSAVLGLLAALRLCLVAATGGSSLVPESTRASHCGAFFFFFFFFFLWSMLWALGARASVVVAFRLSCPTACGIFPDQGLNLCPLH